MHPLTNFFNYLKRIDFSLALEREHKDERELTEWYPEWMYELMETDEVRTKAYRDAIEDTVAGKIVLELGTGRKALLATYCITAGAQKVYAIEANKSSFDASVAFVKAQGIENIEIIHGFSDRVQIPERCDVLVHDLIGDIGSSEGMVPFIADARQRFLKPGAIHIPKRCTTYAVLVEDPRLSLSESSLSFALRGFRRFESLQFVRFFGFPHEAALSAPMVFEDLLLDRETTLKTARQIVFAVTRDGLLRGVCLFIRLFLTEAHVVDTWESHTSWSTPYIRLDTKTAVKKGDLIEANIETNLAGSARYSLTLVHKSDGKVQAIGAYAWSGD